jgi:hypothetical protein
VRDWDREPIGYAQAKLFVDLLQAPLSEELKGRVTGSFPRTTWSAGSAAMQAIAPLAGVDGAIVMTSDLKLLGFGAKIQTGSASDIPVVRFKARPGEQEVIASRLEDLGGMRHQSAARFIEANRGAVAIVVSQDRHVSLMNWEAPFGCGGCGTKCGMVGLSCTPR